MSLPSEPACLHCHAAPRLDASVAFCSYACVDAAEAARQQRLTARERDWEILLQKLGA